MNPTRRTIDVYGPDPLGSAIADSFDVRTMLELSGEGAPASIRVGMTGDPTRVFAGDMGPIQRFPTMAGNAANVMAAQPQALPATSGPAASSTKSHLLSGTLA